MSLLDDFIDTGAKAMIVAMKGDDKEYKRLVEKGISIKKEMDQAHINQEEMKNFFEDKPKPRRKEKRIKLTTNLGDIFKAAGVKVK